MVRAWILLSPGVGERTAEVGWGAYKVTPHKRGPRRPESQAHMVGDRKVCAVGPGRKQG